MAGALVQITLTVSIDTDSPTFALAAEDGGGFNLTSVPRVIAQRLEAAGIPGVVGCSSSARPVIID